MSSLGEAVFQEGMEKGIEKGIEKVAKDMLKDNLSITMIMKYTGLSREEIEKLR